MTVNQDRWRLEVFATDHGREPFTAFADALSDTAFAALDAALRHVLAARGIGLVSSEYLVAWQQQEARRKARARKIGSPRSARSERSE